MIIHYIVQGNSLDWRSTVVWSRDNVFIHNMDGTLKKPFKRAYVGVLPKASTVKTAHLGAQICDKLS